MLTSISRNLLSISAALTTISGFQLSPSNLLIVGNRFPIRSVKNSQTTFRNIQKDRINVHMSATTSVQTVSTPSWAELESLSGTQVVGLALNDEVKKRSTGRGSAHVKSDLRLFSSTIEKPQITLWRDQAGWCPYCQKTMLLIEEKEIPINIGLVPMRSYGDKPAEFLRMVPSGLLPAIVVETSAGQQVITESQVIMELLDKWHPASEGYKPMLPDEDNTEDLAKYDKLARLERELFSWWCTLTFRPEGPRMSNVGAGLMGMITGKKDESEISGAMKGFLDCLSTVDKELASSSGPWFFDNHSHPTMIDFVFVSHIERMLASCAYWKGLNLRSKEMKQKYAALNAWLDAFEKKEHYLAFKSDYYTHIKDIPPQYGPGYDGGFGDKQPSYSKMITGKDGSWSLPLPHDDPLQPLYRGPPLPLCVLEAADIRPDDDGTYESSNPDLMAKTCRHMAGWKLAGYGDNISQFAARGGSKGALNLRKPFAAELADPYAKSDEKAKPYVDNALRVVCQGMLGESESQVDHMTFLETLEKQLHNAVPSERTKDVVNSLAYLRDRIGVPRDLPLASGRTLRAHLNWAIDTLK